MLVEVPLSSGDQICMDFIDAFTAVFHSEDKVGKAFATAYRATIDEYTNVYSSKLDIVISMLVGSGTQCILDGDNRQAQLDASFACYFEDIIAVKVDRSKAFKYSR